eukprot:TRINITY_DN9987_c0_g1_i1.p1 TRINITY_DN9987_c0_g1~~TRINITY_DN9987_c0_g1_i1.p1  ORF type:complete len:225 (-),score=49.42 TRINITY_DN9987_c0_g1_i1:5-679(-)
MEDYNNDIEISHLRKDLLDYSETRRLTREDRRTDRRKWLDLKHNWEKEDEAYRERSQTRNKIDRELHLYEREKVWELYDRKVRDDHKDRQRYLSEKYQRQDIHDRDRLQRNRDFEERLDLEKESFEFSERVYRRRKDLSDRIKMRQAMNDAVLDPIGSGYSDDILRTIRESKYSTNIPTSYSKLKKNRPDKVSQLYEEEKELEKEKQWYSDRTYNRRLRNRYNI